MSNYEAQLQSKPQCGNDLFLLTGSAPQLPPRVEVWLLGALCAGHGTSLHPLVPLEIPWSQCCLHSCPAFQHSYSCGSSSQIKFFPYLYPHSPAGALHPLVVPAAPSRAAPAGAPLPAHAAACSQPHQHSWAVSSCLLWRSQSSKGVGQCQGGKRKGRKSSRTSHGNRC